MINYQFLQTLAPEAQKAFLIAQRMMETGESIGRASWSLTGGSWSPARLANGLSRVSQVMGQTHAFPEVEQVVAHGLNAARAAGVTLGGGGSGIVLRTFSTIGRWIARRVGMADVSSTTAAAVGIVATKVVLGVATWGVASYLGSRAGDQPLQAGPRMLRTASNPVQAPGSTGAGPYFIYSINASGPNIVVGSKSDVAKQSCAFVEW